MSDREREMRRKAGSLSALRRGPLPRSYTESGPVQSTDGWQYHTHTSTHKNREIQHICTWKKSSRPRAKVTARGVATGVRVHFGRTPSRSREMSGGRHNVTFLRCRHSHLAEGLTRLYCVSKVLFPYMK